MTVWQPGEHCTDIDKVTNLWHLLLWSHILPCDNYYFSICNIKKKFSCQQTGNISQNSAFFFKMVTSHRYMLISEKLGLYLLWIFKVPAICHSSGKSAVKVPMTMSQEFVLSCSYHYLSVASQRMRKRVS